MATLWHLCSSEGPFARTEVAPCAWVATVTGPGAIWIGSMVVDCSDLPRMIAFWQATLHYVPRDTPEPDGVVLRDPGDLGPNLSLNRTDESPLADYRIHLDLYSSHPEEELERLARLGAAATRPAEGEHDFVTMADPDGNLFDVIDKKGWSPGQRA
ncbi:MAG: VOC family protein [Thermoplasmata archaeon]|nr:VOC family protein [Thermoplasmata archaeon]